VYAQLLERAQRRDFAVILDVVEQWAEHVTGLTGSEYWTREEDLTSTDDATLEAEEEEVTRRIATMRDRWAAGVIGDEDFIPLIEQLCARLAQIDHDRQLHEPLVVQGADGHRDGLASGMAAQRALLAQHIERITVGPVAKRGSHTFDPSTVSISWRTPVDGAGARSPTRLLGPPVQLEIRGRASPRPAGRRAECLTPTQQSRRGSSREQRWRLDRW
jgi:hypothetical protein